MWSHCKLTSYDIRLLADLMWSDRLGWSHRHPHLPTFYSQSGSASYIIQCTPRVWQNFTKSVHFTITRNLPTFTSCITLYYKTPYYGSLTHPISEISQISTPFQKYVKHFPFYLQWMYWATHLSVMFFNLDHNETWSWSALYVVSIFVCCPIQFYINLSEMWFMDQLDKINGILFQTF